MGKSDGFGEFCGHGDSGKSDNIGDSGDLGESGEYGGFVEPVTGGYGLPGEFSNSGDTSESC